jgi:hypothetical protein
VLCLLLNRIPFQIPNPRSLLYKFQFSFHVSELFFFFVGISEIGPVVTNSCFLSLWTKMNFIYLFSFQCWVGIWFFNKSRVERFFFFFVENLELWKLQVLSILKNQYFVSLTIMNILVWPLNLKWPHVSFTCCQKVAPKIYPFTLNTLHKFFLSFTKNTTNKHELGVIFISCSHICDWLDWTK